MGNRVDDLEKQVAELQAAVDGLTEELVESKERISQLERSTEVEEPSSPNRNPNAEFVPNESAADGANSQKVMADDENDAQKAARGADGETVDESESSEDDSDDIIVA
ncbi:DUF7518 family protein [Halobaculum marinum]|uniref:Chromosome segregation protein SMC n=1 Tax=Halobaculum marinum TaxID=3031996 RepID=A0ABD5X1P8_9EURY|nr:chromosome segregation protein SMC [Halobaculum sp. DT55]